MPQKAPLSAPTPVILVNCLVFGFFFPSGQLTMAASRRVINCFFCLNLQSPEEPVQHHKRSQISELLKLL